MKRRIVAMVIAVSAVHLLVLLAGTVVVATAEYQRYVTTLRRAVVGEVTRRLTDYAALLQPVEDSLESFGTTQLESVVAEVARDHGLSRSDPPPSHLVDRLARDRPFVDVYFIGTDSVVYAASLADDVGLDLSRLGPDTVDLLRVTRERGGIVNARLSISSMTGRLMVYAFYSPPEVDWIVEISVDVRPYVREIYGSEYETFLFDRYWSQLSGDIDGLDRLDVVSLTDAAAWSFIDGTPRNDILDAGIAGRLATDADGVYRVPSRRTAEFGHLEIFSLIAVPELTYHFANELLVETVLDVGAQIKQLVSMVGIMAFVSVVIGVTVAMVAAWYLRNRLFRPLGTLQAQFALAASGDYDRIERHPAAVPAYSEFRQIFDAMSTMIDAIQERERALVDSNQQKKILLQEIHHRVKNNLQVMASLLNLERNRVDIRPADEALQAAESRISAIAAVHTLLYQSDRLGFVEMADFIRRQADHIFDLYDSPDITIEPTFALDDLVCPMDQAVSLALILTEVFTNAVKHGASADGTVRIDVALTTGDGTYTLSIADHGAGFGESQASRVGALGFQLVRQLAGQLRAELELGERPGGGAAVRIRGQVAAS